MAIRWLVTAPELAGITPVPTDGENDFRSYTRAQLEAALSRIDRERYPQNYKSLIAELSSRPIEPLNLMPLPPTPRNVSYAVWLLWATLVLGELRVIVVFPYLPKTVSFGTTIGVYVVSGLAFYLVFWWLRRLARGSNAVRTTLVVLFVMWLPFAYGQFVTAYSRSILEGNIFAVQQLLYLAALTLLFSRPCTEWYRAHAQRAVIAT
jgi:hypothetical protein